MIHFVELGDEALELRKLGKIDLALPDQIEDDFAEMGEGVVAATRFARGIETVTALARPALEGVTQGSGLCERGAQKRTKCAAELGAARSSLPCHASSVYRRRAMTRWLVGLGAVVALAACPPPEPVAPLPPVSGGKVRVRVFTEPAPVKTVGTAGRFLFVATEDGVQRWDERGSLITMSSGSGLSGHVVAMATDPERKWMWILTDGGLGHYDTSNE